MSKRAKRIFGVIAVLVLVLILFRVFGRSKDEELKVTAETVQKRTIIETVNASGKIYPEVEVKISPDISGEITELNVEEGDSVRKGQILARIYADIYSSERDRAQATVAQSQATVANSQAALDALRAQLDQAKSTYDRNKGLYDDKVISKSEFEQFETAYRTAQSQYNAALQNIRSLQANTSSARTGLEMANKNLGRTTLTAPMDGVISSLSVKKGERVAGNSFNVGTEMMRVADLSSMEVRVDVGENDIVKVHIGDSADVEVEAYNNRKFKGIVTQIPASPKTGSGLTASADVTNYEVQIRLDPSSYRDLLDPSRPKSFPFRSGMNASAEIKTRRQEGVISVPISAVGTRMKGSDKNIDEQKAEAAADKDESEMNSATAVTGDDAEVVVFVIGKDNKVEKRVVTTGIQDMNNYEITTGLKEGEKVVTAPYGAVSKTLKNGDQVKVVAKEELFEKK